MQDKDFMSVNAHFDAMVAQLPPAQAETYRGTKHARVETAFRNRHFVVYDMVGRTPHVLDRIIINDFTCDDEKGASAELTSTDSGQTLIINYRPQQLFRFPVFVAIPLHTKIRWGALEDDIDGGSLAFPILIRTRSRLHLRERGVTYCETGPAFGQEFDAPAA